MVDKLFFEEMLGQWLFFELALSLTLANLNTSPFDWAFLENEGLKSWLRLQCFAWFSSAEVANGDKFRPLRRSIFFSEDISLSLIWLFKHLVVIFLQRSGFRIKFTMKTPHHRCSKHHLCLVQFPSWLFMLKLLQICYLMIGYPGLGPAVKRRACFIDKLVFV